MKTSHNTHSHYFGVLVFLMLCLFFIFDVWIDLKESVSISHVWHEAVLFAIAVVGAGWQFKMLLEGNAKVLRVQRELLETKQSYLAWQKKSKNSAAEIREMIGQQLEDWKLSEGEKDVALLLIKGLAMKEIASLRNTQEKTVRQQATTIYRKAGVSGRQELAAFFLEDILSMP